MRSLWRILALQWLGGEGSEVLTGDSAVLDRLAGEQERTTRPFQVRRESGVSHQAMMSSRDRGRADVETAIEKVLRNVPRG